MIRSSTFSSLARTQRIIHRMATKQQIAAQQRAWYAANLEKGRASVRAWNSRNREKLRQYQRTWYATHAEQQRKRVSDAKKRRLRERPEEVHRYFKTYRVRRIRVRVAEAMARRAPHSYFQDLGPEFRTPVEIGALRRIHPHASSAQQLIDSVFLDHVHADGLPRL
jgi:hypothetical protein